MFRENICAGAYLSDWKSPCVDGGVIPAVGRCPLLRVFHKPRNTALAAHRVGSPKMRSSANKRVLSAAGDVPRAHEDNDSVFTWTKITVWWT